MQYRKFKDEKISISTLGMGAMRLPAGKDDQAREGESIELIRYAIDQGITYVDTGYTYHGGKSEEIVGKALKEGYREKALLADKMPIWLAKTEEDVDRIFNEQMKRLDVECIDMYLVHNIIPYNWKKTQKLNLLSYLEKKKEEGKIKYIGFSFHGEYDLFQEVVDSYPWDFCQIQLNYIDAEKQAGVKGLEYAAAKGLGVIIMEPLKGGKLTDHVPEQVTKIWENAPTKRGPAEWAFHWLAAQKGIITILSGMNTKEQIDQNIEIFDKENLGVMTDQESDMIRKAAEEYNRMIRYQCTSCKYCMPCPAKLDIPTIIRDINNWYAYGKNHGTYIEYTRWLFKHGSDCVGCGQCEEKCPQSLKITEIMKDAADQFGI